MNNTSKAPIYVNIVVLLTTIIFVILKFYYAFLTSSIALQADAFDNLTDIIMIIASLIGLIFSNKKPNEKFPYGYYKIENVVSLIISIFIFITAYEIITKSLTALFLNTDHMILFTGNVIWFLIISLSATYILSIFMYMAGKKTQSPVIKSEAKEKFYDTFISLSVIIGYIGAFYKIYFVDSILGVVISIFIIKGGYEIFKTSTKTLLDAVIDFDDRKKLEDTILNVPNVKEIENIEIRAYGKYISLEVEISVPDDLSLPKVEMIKDKMSQNINEEFPQFFRILIIASFKEGHIKKSAVPLENNNGLDSMISGHYGEAEFFGILEIEELELRDFEIISNKYASEEKRKGILISDWLCSKKIDKIYLQEDLKRGPKLVFENSLVQIILKDAPTLKKLLEKEHISYT